LRTGENKLILHLTPPLTAGKMTNNFTNIFSIHTSKAVERAATGRGDASVKWEDAVVESSRRRASRMREVNGLAD
jgi:hypothetical protein